MTVTTPPLAQIIATHAGVTSTYRHQGKHATVGTPVLLPGAALKWYAIQPRARPVAPEVTALAYDLLTTSPLTPEGLGFVLLHRCEGDFYFLIVSTWRNANELWETVWYKDGAAMVDFAPFARDGSHLPTFCVWELGPVWHEKLAWERFLGSARDPAAAQVWFDDGFAGAV